MAMTFQVAAEAKPVGSVKRICDAGHMIVFDSEGSYIVSKMTGDLNWLREDNLNCMLDLWFQPPAKVGTAKTRIVEKLKKKKGSVGRVPMVMGIIPSEATLWIAKILRKMIRLLSNRDEIKQSQWCRRKRRRRIPRKTQTRSNLERC